MLIHLVPLRVSSNFIKKTLSEYLTYILDCSRTITPFCTIIFFYCLLDQRDMHWGSKLILSKFQLSNTDNISNSNLLSIVQY